MDYQAVGVAVAAVATSVGAIVTGVYTGRNSRAKDQNEARIHLEQARYARDQAEEEASRVRIEAIAKDAADARRRARELEDEFDRRYSELRAHAQRGWDLAAYHFGLVSFLGHLINNIFMALEPAEKGREAILVDTTRNAYQRMKTTKLPISLEEPLEKKPPLMPTP